MTLRRIAAFAVDWLCIIAYAALLIPLGLLLAHWVGGLATWSQYGRVRGARRAAVGGRSECVP